MMASWENSATEPVLELLADSGLALPPAVITHNLQQEMKRPPSSATVTRAIRGLREQGLVAKDEETDYYRITSEGEQYLTDNPSDPADDPP